jgi:elongator complex protein 1
VVNDVSLTEEGYMPDDGSGKLVGIQELAELESVCVATATGDVILYNLTTNEVSRKLI